MKHRIGKRRHLLKALGPVEQAQIVASTAVVVAMVTIVMVRVFSDYKMNWYDFVSVITVGIFGFLIVYFTLKYGQLLEEQKQELLALNKIAEAVNRAVEIDILLKNALREVKGLLDADYAWMYHTDGNNLVLKTALGSDGMEETVLPPLTPMDSEKFEWVVFPRIRKRPGRSRMKERDEWPWKKFKSWASVPIMMKDNFSGVMILASNRAEAFTEKQLELMTAFANQVGVALENATLFERLRRSEERYADLFENSPDMYHIVNRSGIILSCNKTEATHLGYSKEELIGHSILRLYPASYHEQAHESLREMFEEDYEAKGLEEEMVTKEGDLIQVSVNTSIIYDEEGRAALVRWVGRDITERKKLESKILHAQRIDSIGNLAGGVAHDFNNILTSILGSTAIMKRKMKTSDQWYRFADIIESAARRGASLTRQLLTFARKSPVQFKPLLLNDVVSATLHLFGRSTDKTIDLETSLAADAGVINGDEGQLQQALLNLLINARDAMPEGGKIVVATDRTTVDRERKTDMGEIRAGRYVSISVRDTGIGMDTETRQRIFEPFFTTKEQGKGTGLGLSVVYGVVNAHNGFISVQSERGRGSEFRLYLPLLEVKETMYRKAKTGQVFTGDKRILVVDDEEHVGDVIAGMLKNLGYKVSIVRSGAQAVARVKRAKKKFDVVILDMNMPRMGGKETLAKLRKLEPALRVIVSTGYSTTSLESSPISEAISGFLQKPYQIEELSKAIREVLDR